MSGPGSPQGSRGSPLGMPAGTPTGRSARVSPQGRFPFAPSERFAHTLIGWCLAWLVPWGDVAAAQTAYRLRIEWGGGNARAWQGQIALSGGRILDLHPLGVQPDEQAVAWPEPDGLRIFARKPRGYMGFDFEIEAGPEAVLSVSLGDGAPVKQPLSIPLSRLVDDVVEETLDDQRNWLQLRRAPGDRLRVDFDRPGLVFRPGETFSFRAAPGPLNVKAGTKAVLDVILSDSRSGTEISRRQLTVADASRTDVPLTVDLPLPSGEGIYDVSLVLQTPRLGISPPIAKAWWQNAAARRRIQVIVIDPRGAPSAAPSPRAGGPRLLEEIDPTHPARWQRLGNLTMLPGMRKAPLSAGKMSVVPYRIGTQETKLAGIEGESIPGEPAWQAYPLAVAQVGRPHVVEIEYPRNVPQFMGISIVEPVLGELVAATIDGGVCVPPEAEDAPAGLLRHRVAFRPRSRAPLVLISAQRGDSPALHGKIRLWECGTTLTQVTLTGEASAWTPAPDGPARRRTLAVQLDDVLFLDTLLAERAVDPASRRSLQDWRTFYDGTVRLLEYMKASQRDTLYLAVAADGGTLYPSRLLNPTPKLDDGILFGDGQDPLRKDVLEMLLRLCDREGIRCIPVVRWNAPLPSLELLRRAGPDAAAGLEAIGPDGRPVPSPLQTRWGLAGYNLLDERVQGAMLAVVRELVPRLAGHPCCEGIAFELAGDGYAVPASPAVGLDDRTSALFEHEAGMRVPAAGPDRLRQRMQLFSQEPLRSRWLLWRARRTAAFHAAVQDELRRHVPQGRLHLLPARLWTGPELRQIARDSLTQGGTLLDPWLAVGLDPRLYAGPDKPLLLRPNHIGPQELLPAGDLEPDLNDAADLDAVFAAGERPGTVFHLPMRTRVITSPETSNLLRSPPKLTLTIVPVVGGDAARRRFARLLVGGDHDVWCDAGPTLGLGDEALLQQSRELFRNLPAERFGTVAEVPQPLVLRTLNGPRDSWLYAVNDSPWPLTATVPLAFPRGTPVEALSSAPHLLRPTERGAIWELDLAPYEARGIRVRAGGVQTGETSVSPGFDWTAALRTRLGDLGGRMAGLLPLDDGPDAPVMSWNLTKELSNPGFEVPPTRDDPLPGWAANRQAGVEAASANDLPHGGQFSGRLKSTGPVATLAGPPLDVPPSGVLLLSVWLRCERPAETAPLRLAVEGSRPGGTPYYRFATLGGPNGPRLDTAWRSYLFRVDDLAAAGVTDVRIRFDLMGPGEVRFDDVQLSSVLLTGPDLIHLRKNLATARFALDAGRGNDARRMLGSYWPRVLAREVPVVQSIRAEPETDVVAAPPSPPPAPVETTNRGWYDRLVPTWWR